MLLITFYSSNAQANNPDSLTEEKKNLIRIVGSLVKGLSKNALDEGRTDAGSKSVLGNAAKEVLKGTARRSADKILRGEVDIRNGIKLPDLLEQKRELFKQKGKEILLDNFQQSLREASQNALRNTVLKMAEKAIDFDVEDLVRFAGSDTMAITDVFKNAKQSTLVEVAKPIAKSAFKLAGGNKTFKKLKKTYNKLSDEKLDLNNEDLIAEKITGIFLEEMKAQEQQLKNNPLNLLDTLINLFKQ